MVQFCSYLYFCYTLYISLYTNNFVCLPFVINIIVRLQTRNYFNNQLIKIIIMKYPSNYLFLKNVIISNYLNRNIYLCICLFNLHLISYLFILLLTVRSISLSYKGVSTRSYTGIYLYHRQR